MSVTEPTTKSSSRIVQIDISQVPEEKRNDPRFWARLAAMQQDLLEPKKIHAVCVHEAAHAVFRILAGTKQLPSATGPRISYDAAKDEFNGTMASIKFEDRNVGDIPADKWFDYITKSYAAGGVAARVLANSVETGDDDDDRENFNRAFALMKPYMTRSAEEQWIATQHAVENDLRQTRIQKWILDYAEDLKTELFLSNFAVKRSAKQIE